jgi:hypothetical protein
MSANKFTDEFKRDAVGQIGEDLCDHPGWNT